MKGIVRISVVTMLVLLAVLPVAGFSADQRAFYGFLVSYKGNTLTVEDREGRSERFDVTRDTLVTSQEGTAKLERVLPGTRLSVTAKGDRAVIVTIKEVPK